MKPFFLLLVIVTSSLDAIAVEVYKTVDESGAVVFSDQKTSDAEMVKVQQPNAVNLNTPVMPESSSQNKSTKHTSTKPKGSQQEVVVTGTVNNGNLHRKKRNVTNSQGNKGQGNNSHKPSAAPRSGQRAR